MQSLVGLSGPKNALKLNSKNNAFFLSAQTIQPSSRRHGFSKSIQSWRHAIKASIQEAPARPTSSTKKSGSGHSALLQGLGDVGDVPPTLMPWLLRLSHVSCRIAGGDSAAALQDAARGVLTWKAALERGLVPDDSTLNQLTAEKDSFVAGLDPQSLVWPAEPLRAVLIRRLSTLAVARFAAKYPAVRDALLKGLMEIIVKHYKAVLGEVDVEDRAVDGDGNVFKTATELMEEEAARRGVDVAEVAGRRNPNVVPSAGAQQASTSTTTTTAQQQQREQEEAEAAALLAEEQATWTPERRTAEELVSTLVSQWEKPIAALDRAGRAFDGLEALLGGGMFELGGGIWNRRGWADMDKLREKLEDVRELRDLVRSLGRGGGWGPLRRAPVQRLEMKGRPGLLRTTLEAQETRGLTRSDDISRLLPSEAAMLARGRQVRQAKLLFYARLAEKGLSTYERDGWGEFPTDINIERREIRPTADRGPILLCVDTSGSMRGPRETVAKALALECMRAAKAQERGCYVFAFAGPQEVRELELNMDAKSVNNLLDFLEKTFNGGSDFNAPVQRCLDRLTDAKWANSDILLVSDGELRQPGGDVMRKLSGAKDKLALRVHGLILGSPEKKRADPAVLRGLCSHILPKSGKLETLVHEFDSWPSVMQDRGMKFDWDDAVGDAARREAGLRLEKLRSAEMKRRRSVGKGPGAGSGSSGKAAKQAVRMPGKNTTSFE
ncbi:hypothetical protein Ndes2437B_g05113 [Nannochloris sp. 'desiccata']|nr:hypothetical protein KSW81_003134 [Chlorella desiccata (nom. nud.)]